MERYLCIHGHFYQPPRENPWLEAVEVQDSAYPYHDWNERITAECYAPNTASRTVDGDGRIMAIASNYSRISFNFGPTLLSWLERFSPEVYRAILDADRQSITLRSGHGNAIAQVYNHLIMPLATRRDKETQVIWGIRDFERRFGRFPEGMWLAETAADTETLEVLAEAGIAFTILAPHQARRVRRRGMGRWKEVSGGHIDPTRPYLCRLPSGRSITLFFYDGPISRAVAFENLLSRGETFAERLVSGFSGHRSWPQLLHIATDGETYGHHHRFGDMALSHALNHIEGNGLARLTNYGEYLALHPPTHEAQIIDNASWSCLHGIERWRSDCGCNSGGRPGWTQQWRAPLRDALDWLREELAARFETEAARVFPDPGQARNEYIDVVLDRSEISVARFLLRHAAQDLNSAEQVRALSLLEMERHALLMFTSCGWFFDELTGLETVQVLQYAGRALQLAEVCGSEGVEDGFVQRLALARGNVAECPDGATAYERYVRPAKVNLIKVAAHYAVSSIFEEYGDTVEMFSYFVDRMDHRTLRAGHTRVAIGRIHVRSSITRRSGQLTFCTLYFGNHAVNGGVRPFRGEEAYASMKEEITAAFEASDLAGIIRLMDIHFGMHTYSLKDLFRDEQRAILKCIIGSTMADFETTFQSLFDNNRLLMRFLQEAAMPVPRRFLATAEIALNLRLQHLIGDDAADVGGVREVMAEMNEWQVQIDDVELEFVIRRKIEGAMAALDQVPFSMPALAEACSLAKIAASLPVSVNLWQSQNICHSIARRWYPEMRLRAAGDRRVSDWVNRFRDLCALLHFNVQAILGE